MTANEIVKQMEECLSPALDSCDNCPYDKKDDKKEPYWCIGLLMEDALKLLKPRVLSLTEWEAMDDPQDGTSLCYEIKDSDGNSTMQAMLVKAFSRLSSMYNREFRVWTARPSDEQRRATPWEVVE